MFRSTTGRTKQGSGDLSSQVLVSFSDPPPSQSSTMPPMMAGRTKQGSGDQSSQQSPSLPVLHYAFHDGTFLSYGVVSPMLWFTYCVVCHGSANPSAFKIKLLVIDCPEMVFFRPSFCCGMTQKKCGVSMFAHSGPQMCPHTDSSPLPVTFPSTRPQLSPHLLMIVVSKRL